MKIYKTLTAIRENIVPLLTIAEKHNLPVDISAMQPDEAISELEAIQSRGCEGCKHGKYGADSRGIEVECTLIWHCARGNCFPDRYEQKEK